MFRLKCVFCRLICLNFSKLQRYPPSFGVFRRLSSSFADFRRLLGFWMDPFKVASFVHQSSGILPSYLADDCCLVADARERRLCSTASWTCVVTRRGHTAPLATERSRLLDPDYGTVFHMKDADLSYNEFFRRSLILFGQWGHGAVWTLLH